MNADHGRTEEFVDDVDREFMDRVEAVIASKALLGNLRLYFECLGFVKQEANRERFLKLGAAMNLVDFMDEALLLVLQQAKAEETSLAMLIWDGFSNPRSVQFRRLFERRTKS